MAAESNTLQTFYNLVMNSTYNEEFITLLRDNPEYGVDIPTCWAYGVDEEDYEEEGLKPFYNIEEILVGECDVIDTILSNGYTPLIPKTRGCKHCIDAINESMDNYSYVKPAKK